MPILVTQDGAVLARRLSFARTPRERLRGLLGRRLEPDEALIIEPASQIHTFGMRYAIDAVFCDGRFKVVHIARDLSPWRVTRWVRGARCVIELPAGSIPRTLGVGETLEIS